MATDKRVFILTTLENIAKKLMDQKNQAAKIRRQQERALKEAKSLGRRSSSGLKRLEKHLEHDKEILTDINMEFNHILSRKESLERLAKSAQERLIKENDLKEQAEIDLANAENDEIKSNAQYRLDMATEKIQEIESELKIREKAVQKVENEIINYKQSQSAANKKIHKEVSSKPALLTQLKESKIDSAKFQKQLLTAEKREVAASLALAKISAKLEEIKSKRRKTKSKKSKTMKKITPKKKTVKKKTIHKSIKKSKKLKKSRR